MESLPRNFRKAEASALRTTPKNRRGSDLAWARQQEQEMLGQKRQNLHLHLHSASELYMQAALSCLDTGVITT